MSSAQTDTRDAVATLLEDLFGVPAGALAPEVELQEGLQLDSLSVIELQVAIEDSFGIRFDDAPHDTADVVTFGDLVAVVDRLR